MSLWDFRIYASKWQSGKLGNDALCSPETASRSAPDGRGSLFPQLSAVGVFLTAAVRWRDSSGRGCVKWNLRKAFLSKFRQVSSLTYEKNKSETQAKHRQTRSPNPLQAYFLLLISQPSHIDTINSTISAVLKWLHCLTKHRTLIANSPKWTYSVVL